MIVPKEAVEGILAGRVTACRIPLTRWNPRSSTKTHTLKAARVKDPETGRRGKPGRAICLLKIVRTDIVNLEHTTEEDARAEGYGSVEEYMLAYLAAFDSSWTDTLAYKVTFVVDRRERPRLLANQQGRRFTEGNDTGEGNDEGQYTASPALALPGEPEAVDPKTLARFSDEAMRKGQKIRDEANAMYRSLPIEIQLRRALEEAKRAGVDTTIAEASIARRVESLRSKVRKEAA
jgi:hypothetical protein